MVCTLGFPKYGETKEEAFSRIQEVSTTIIVNASINNNFEEIDSIDWEVTV